MRNDKTMRNGKTSREIVRQWFLRLSLSLCLWPLVRSTSGPHHGQPTAMQWLPLRRDASVVLCFIMGTLLAPGSKEQKRGKNCNEEKTVTLTAKEQRVTSRVQRMCCVWAIGESETKRTRKQQIDKKLEGSKKQKNSQKRKKKEITESNARKKGNHPIFSSSANTEGTKCALKRGPG